ncbi:MAG: hypothetical protein PHC70_03735 [Patescibacteria group bacterium]|nr:hypothetical protein [Patescibacteria group bacterium]
MKIVGFEKSPFAKAEISRLVGILPDYLTEDLGSIAYAHSLPEGYRLKGIDHAKVRSLVLPGESKKMIFVSPGHENEQERFFYAARFLNDFLRTLAVGMLADQERADLVTQAFSTRPRSADPETWRKSLVNRFCSRGISMDDALDLCHDVEEVLGELDQEFDVPKAAYDLSRWHQGVIRRLASESVRKMINSSLEDKYDRAGWLHRILHGDSAKHGQALPEEVAGHLRVLLAQGEAHRAASLHGLAEALEAYEA